MRPRALSMPLRTLYPLPRLPGFSTSRRIGSFLGEELRTMSAVLSREPSLTTITSASQPWACDIGENLSRVAPRRALSL